MSRINLNNYEAFVLDYLEGNLSKNLIQELKTFVLLNPDLNIDLESMDLPVLEKDEQKLADKLDLRKTETQQLEEKVLSYLEGLMNEAEKAKFEIELKDNSKVLELMNAFSKTRLPADVHVVFDRKEALMANGDAVLLADPALNFIETNLFSDNLENKLQVENKHIQTEVAAYLRTKLIADQNVVYPNKQELKKEGRVLVLFSNRTMTAVAAGLFLLIGLIFVWNVYLNTDKVQTLGLSYNEIEADHKTNKSSELFNTKSTKEYSVNVLKADNSNSKREKISTRKRNISTTPNLIKKDSTVIENNLINTNENNDNLIAVESTNKEIDHSSLMTKDTALINNSPSLMNSNRILNKPANTMLAYESDDEEPVNENRKQGFWSKVAQLAGNANKLGMKAVNGKSSEGDGFLLSFNTLSIEKK